MADSAVLKSRAKKALSGHWGSAVLVTLIAAILGGTGSGINLNWNIDENTYSILVQEYPAVESTVRTIMAVMPIIIIYGLIVTIIGGMVQLGYCQYCVKLCLGVDEGIKELFVHKNLLLKAFALNIVIAIKIMLWSFLFVIPGIVAGYRYAMAPYLMAENPDMGIMEAIDASKEIMDGHKGELFWLELTFIGWTFLAAFTLGIGLLWLNPYMNMAEAEFYLDLTGRGQNAELV